MVSDSQYQFCFLHIALVLKAHREKRTQHLMSIVSSSHTPQGRGEEKGANYKWPHPVLPDFSSSGIGPRFISAQAALRQDPPRLLGAPRCHEVRGEAARSRPPAGRGGPGPPAVLPWPWLLPGAPRLPSAVPRGHRARTSPLPAAAANGAHIRGCSVPRCGAGRCGPGGRKGHWEKSLPPAQASNLPSNGGEHAASSARFSERVQSLATLPRGHSDFFD